MPRMKLGQQSKMGTIMPGTAHPIQDFGRDSVGLGLFHSESTKVFDSLDFSKPEKYLREIYQFIEQNSIPQEGQGNQSKMKISNLTLLKKTNNFQTLSGQDA